MTTKKSNIIFNKNISKEEYQSLFEQFKKHNGYMTKLIDKRDNSIIGYLTRSEIPGHKNFVAISFVPFSDYYSSSRNTRFVKSIAMNKVLNAGTRRLQKFVEKNGSIKNFESETILSKIISPENLDEETKEYYNYNGSTYNDIYNYIISFENKIKTYYNDKQIKIVVI
jgi:hypothetical protein